MSRIGRKPIPVPKDVTVSVDGRNVKVKGAKGELSMLAPSGAIVKFDEASREVKVERPDDSRSSRAIHGLTRSLVSNMVTGVTTPFTKKLEIQGVGYNAALAGQTIKLQVGFANTIVLPIPAGVTCTLVDPTHIAVTSPDKHAAGQFAANIRKVRPPEPYKGKGIRYEGEQVRRKAGKAGAGGK